MLDMKSTAALKVSLSFVLCSRNTASAFRSWLLLEHAVTLSPADISPRPCSQRQPAREANYTPGTPGWDVASAARDESPNSDRVHASSLHRISANPTENRKRLVQLQPSVCIWWISSDILSALVSENRFWIFRILIDRSTYLKKM